MERSKVISLIIVTLALTLLTNCSEDEVASAEPDDDELPAVFDKFYGVTDIYVEGDYIVIKANGVPDHKSPYFENTQWEATMYIEDTRPSFEQAPGNKVSSLNFTFKIPKNPTEAANKTALGTATMVLPLMGFLSLINTLSETAPLQLTQWNTSHSIFLEATPLLLTNTIIILSPTT